ncbi:1,4-alpha-glucan branching protein [Streptomyces sp. NPDC053367]|uniref:maltokinase N-terminal cap-like domain-containing protein n=1 Tax=Streptomyces sp. NPDC053367 TaxID=3365700 RepID=UPI0037D506A5
MAVIHHTTLKPTKLELLTEWLPSRPWYRGGSGTPRPEKAGGFRLDDPQGEVGIEFMVVADAATAYLVPLTYRSAPLDGAEHALVGTTEHGVLGKRWVYDACHDPVAVAQLLALAEGRVQAQDQNTSDVPDPEVVAAYTGRAPLTAADIITADDPSGTALTTPDGTTVRLRRVLEPGQVPEGAIGHVTGSWQLPDGSRAGGPFAVVHSAQQARLYARGEAVPDVSA